MPSLPQTLSLVATLIVGFLTLTGVMYTAIRNNKTQVEIVHVNRESQYADDLRADISGFKEEVKTLRTEINGYQVKWFEQEALILDKQKQIHEQAGQITDLGRRITTSEEDCARAKRDQDALISKLQTQCDDCVRRCKDLEYANVVKSERVSEI